MAGQIPQKRVHCTALTSHSHIHVCMQMMHSTQRPSCVPHLYPHLSPSPQITLPPPTLATVISHHSPLDWTHLLIHFFLLTLFLLRLFLVSPSPKHLTLLYNLRLSNVTVATMTQWSTNHHHWITEDRFSMTTEKACFTLNGQHEALEHTDNVQQLFVRLHFRPRT